VSDKREDITQNANTTNLKTWGGISQPINNWQVILANHPNLHTSFGSSEKNKINEYSNIQLKRMSIKILVVQKLINQILQLAKGSGRITNEISLSTCSSSFSPTTAWFWGSGTRERMT
jgi:hypothetical protein